MSNAILFLCVANSSRSQMAEGLARHLRPDHRFLSAGSAPTGLNPYASRAMAELGIDVSRQESTAVDRIDQAQVGTVITLCAEEVCPAFLGQAIRHHWPFDDPAAAEGTEQEILASFIGVRDQIKARLERFFAAE